MNEAELIQQNGRITMNETETIRDFLARNFLLSTDGFPMDNEASLLDGGVIDSTGILELTLFVEETFEIDIEDHEITPENFDSVNSIVRYVNSKRS